ncbi:hypothetical protein M7775_02625 [Sporomusa sphaeroides DSM 2875]|uniref:hypothetical protein n=1 Tax=Sporomusa sphaeroides TaxID=47679 RepID=UPI00202EC5B8|nr:hypothetical protein [Sporomusa sphaeroides]MCM0757462.1 hypothetical protein [Sporomusa sphaeroides DSM 2875]
MDIMLALTDVLSMWKIALPAMFLGCYCGVVLRTGKFFRFFSKLTRPMTALGKLPEALGPFFMLCLLNRFAANAMLADFGKSGAITNNTLMAVYVMGSLPTSIYFSVFYFSPVLVTSLGWELGLSFFFINIGISSLATISGFVWNRLLAKQDETGQRQEQQENCAAAADETDLIAAGRKAFQQFWDIAVVFMPITLAFGFLMHTDLIKDLISGLDPFLRWFKLTAAGVLVIIAGIPTMIAAIGVAGTLLHSGALASQDVIFVLLVASFFHNVYYALSQVLPANLSIFGAKNGTTVTLVGTGIHLAMVVAGAGIALYLKGS